MKQKNIIIVEVIKVSYYVGSFDPYGDNIIQGLVFPVVYQKSGYFFLTCHGSKYPVAQWLSLKKERGTNNFKTNFKKVEFFKLLFASRKHLCKQKDDTRIISEYQAFFFQILPCLKVILSCQKIMNSKQLFDKDGTELMN